LLFDFRQPNGWTCGGVSGPAAYESPSDTYSVAAEAGAASTSMVMNTVSSARPA
jgi:hypothetical protein